MFLRIVENRHFEKLVKWLTFHIRPLTFLWYPKKMSNPPLRSLRRSRRNRNQIRVADEIPIAESIRQMAENLQNFGDGQLVALRSLPEGTHMLGIATEEIQAGDFVTFDYRNTTDQHFVRKITIEEMESITNPGQYARVERVAQAVRHANVDEAIEFIINEHCQYVTSINPAMYPGINPAPKVHEQDLLYPHECYNCHKKLKYAEAWTEIKKTGMTEEKFIHLWELEEIEFYCCFCYDKKTRGRSVGESIYTRFRGTGRTNTNLFLLLSQIMQSATIEGAPEIHEINLNGTPTILFPNPLRTLEAVARHRFGPQPHFTHGFEQEVPHRSIRQFQVDIRIRGAIQDNLQYLQYRHNIVITTEDHERYRGIGPLDLTMTSPMIRTEGLAKLVAELVFHWISAKVLLHPENEEWIQWIPLNDRVDEITPSINYFIERMTHAEGIVGPNALERFAELFPNFPHTWFHNNEGCDFCGLSPLEVYEWSPRGMGAQIADYRERLLWRGTGIQLRPDAAINRVQLYGGIVNGERLEARAENSDAQQQNGVNMFIDHHPAVTSQDELEALAHTRLNRNNGAEIAQHPPVISAGFHMEYNMSPLDINRVNVFEGINNDSLAQIREQVENELIAGTGIPREQLFPANSRLNQSHVIAGAEQNELSYMARFNRNLPETHDCRQHLDRNLHCRICRRSMVDIDAERNNPLRRRLRR